MRATRPAHFGPHDLITPQVMKCGLLGAPLNLKVLHRVHLGTWDSSSDKERVWELCVTRRNKYRYINSPL